MHGLGSCPAVPTQVSANTAIAVIGGAERMGQRERQLKCSNIGVHPMPTEQQALPVRPCS
jgi:hypothetical protein